MRKPRRLSTPGDDPCAAYAVAVEEAAARQHDRDDDFHYATAEYPTDPRERPIKREYDQRMHSIDRVSIKSEPGTTATNPPSKRAAYVPTARRRAETRQGLGVVPKVPQPGPYEPPLPPSRALQKVISATCEKVLPPRGIFVAGQDGERTLEKWAASVPPSIDLASLYWRAEMTTSKAHRRSRSTEPSLQEFLLAQGYLARKPVPQRALPINTEPSMDYEPGNRYEPKSFPMYSAEPSYVWAPAPLFRPWTPVLPFCSGVDQFQQQQRQQQRLLGTPHT
ncbi:hypothetical protein HKX48_005954 [Thoreauomyces humboldtii]|nr:hypothetical protein HKX48_005954 [Thoreauomyces humboldtii]